MDNCHCSDPFFLLELLYGEEEGKKAAEQLQMMLKNFSAPEAPPPLNEADSLLITYADQFQRPGEKPLKTFGEIADRCLKGVVTGLHLLPFFPYSSDDGFSVIDYSQVNPEWGNWEDIARLGQDFRLMFDAVINHISVKSEWFQGFLKDEPAFKDFFISLPENTDLSSVVRPRTSPLLTPFESERGPRWVWTTFSADQVDLNYKNPQVLLKIVENLLIYVEKCAKLLHLDAIAYLWKETGTSCIHLPKTHLLVNFLNALFKKAAPYVLLVTETNVPHQQNVSYFGNGSNEAHMVYNFALPPLVLHTFQTENADVLTEWASQLTLPSMQVTFFNFLASHDGIGLDPARGILSDEEIESMVARALAYGGRVSSKTNQDGTQSPYEINISYFDALSDPASSEALEVQVKRFLAAQAIMLALVGVPGIYVHSLFGTRNWQEGVKITWRNHSINRCRFNADSFISVLSDTGSLQSMTYRGYRKLLHARSLSPAFHPHGAQLVLKLKSKVFSLLRVSPDGMHSVLCLQNVSADSQMIDLVEVKGLAGGVWRDLLSGEMFDLSDQWSDQRSDQRLEMDGFSVLWLVPGGNH
jgi:glycosidase